MQSACQVKPSEPNCPALLRKEKKLKVEERRGPQTGMLSGCYSRKAQGAFKDSMIHILQFTLPIAIRCVLHRWENQEIRCQKLCLDYTTELPNRVNHKDYFIND